MFDRLSSNARLVALGVVSSVVDFRRMFTWRSWTFGWLGRLLAQVVFFSFLGKLVRDPELERYAAVGNALALASFAALGVVSSTSMERRNGTLQFLLLGRGSPFAVMASRGLYWPADGLLTSAVALSLVPIVLGSAIPLSRMWLLVPGEILIATSTYLLGLGLAGLSVRWPEARTYLTATTSIGLMLLAGINVRAPDSGPAGMIAHLLPVTNGLAGQRAVLAGNSPRAPFLAEGLVALGWLAISYLVLEVSIRSSVRAGRLRAA
jgi:ABC-2 type transport system permease protein